MQAALQEEADLIAVVDGDGQISPAYVTDACSLLTAQQLDWVRGNRLRHPDCSKAMPWTRFWGNRLFSFLMRRTTRFDGPLDAQCSFGLFSAAALRVLPLDRLFGRFGFWNDLLFAAVECGWRIGDLPVAVEYGEAQSSIRAPIVIPTILLLILRGWLRLRRHRRSPHFEAAASRQMLGEP